MLSNHIARARLPEDVVASYHPGARGRGRDHATTPKVEEKDILTQHWSKELGNMIHKTSLQRTPKMILKD
jgi:hypothetical protein